MATGSIKWFCLNKGYGFIEPSVGERDVFLHKSAVINAGISVKGGEKVSYDFIKDDATGKTYADNLKLL
ncbi:Cold shock protein [Candidatus Liberibacter americanus str. Sao Paulo]|uniref:Cold shock protein n=1 Tax=Candidatus Liberibacter americanus str. Sao Paulo TaxID=1261131 RepID=U6B5G0_9HYPH|nr:cold shock domain-containing protein [Candidatus Liberibacter americanus]AHA27953.1 Cold shock protein [Candidatus Liberibacter americanus str. Sao Paulo]